MRLSIIVAMDDNQLIGNNNTLPWNLPADLAYFKKTTTGKTVLMGRKTYDSIGKPLPNRRNIVLSRKSQKDSDNREVVRNIREALDKCKNDEEVFIIGGMSVYEQFLNPTLNESYEAPDLFSTEKVMPLVSRIYITQIEGEFQGDAHFPKFNRDEFIEVSRQSHQVDDKNQHAYHFTILDRK